MKSSVMDLYFNTDWAATGAMISAISSIVLIISTWMIAKRQNEINEKLDKNESTREQSRINLSLFDMRFEIYETFMHYYNICKQILEINENYETGNNIS